MAINATIQVRRGLLKDFDPTKMLPGEWAVSIDASTSNQIVWMCFAPGVCKRMGTYEDFQNMVYNATGQIIERYEDAFGSILEEVNTNAEAVSANTDIVLVAKSDIINTYLPQIKSYVSNASASASEAKTYSENAKASASEADKSAEDAKKYSEQAFSTTPDGYEALVDDVDVLKNSIIQTTDRTLSDSFAGGIKLIGIKGASEQGENPSPDNPQEIESVGDLKNLLEVTANSQTVNGVTFTVNEDKSVHVKGTATSGAYFQVGTFVPAIGETYILTGGVKNCSNSTYMLYWNTNNATVIDTGNGSTVTITDNTTKSNGVSLFVASGQTVDLTFYPMIRKASVKNAEYKPYGYSLGIKASNEDGTKSKSITIPLNEPLRSIGDVKDEIVCQDSVWGVLRKIGSYTFDGSETFYREEYSSDGTMGGRIQLSPSSPTLGITPTSNNGTIPNIRCTHYVARTPGNTYGHIQGVTVNTSGVVYFWDDNHTEGVDTYKAWLAENNPTLEYELATPTFEPFTDQTPFYGLESFDTVTYISTDSEVEPSIELKFAKTEGDAVTLLNYNQTNLNRIAIAELTSAVLALNQE